MHKTAVPLLFLLFLACSVSGAASGSPESDYHRANELFSSQNFTQALALYQRALALPPSGVSAGDIHARIGDSHFRLGSFAPALAAFREADMDPRTSDRARVQYWIGFCCFLTGRDAEAVQELLKVPKQYPKSGMWVSTAYYWAGKASERMGRKDLAAEYYKKAAGNGKSSQGKFAMKKAEAAKGK